MKRYYVATVMAVTDQGQDMLMLTIEDQHPFAVAAAMHAVVLFYRPVSAQEFREVSEALTSEEEPAK